MWRYICYFQSHGPKNISCFNLTLLLDWKNTVQSEETDCKVFLLFYHYFILASVCVLFLEFRSNICFFFLSENYFFTRNLALIVNIRGGFLKKILSFWFVGVVIFLFSILCYYFFFCCIRLKIIVKTWTVNQTRVLSLARRGQIFNTILWSLYYFCLFENVKNVFSNFSVLRK